MCTNQLYLKHSLDDIDYIGGAEDDIHQIPEYSISTSLGLALLLSLSFSLRRALIVGKMVSFFISEESGSALSNSFCILAILVSTSTNYRVQRNARVSASTTINLNLTA